jgi:hypothetical protein
MANSVDKLTTQFRSLGPDDASFQAGVNATAQEREQRWPLFKSVSLARQEPTPELSAQERQRWSKLEKVVVGTVRKPALSLPTFNDELTISLSKIAEKAALSTGQPTVRADQGRVHSSFMRGYHDEQQLASNHLNAPNISPTPSYQTQIIQTPEFLSMPVVAMNFEIEPPSSEHISAQKADAMSELSDTNHNDDSLQSLFGRIKAKETAVVRPAENRFSFFDRLKKR